MILKVDSYSIGEKKAKYESGQTLFSQFPLSPPSCRQGGFLNKFRRKHPFPVQLAISRQQWDLS
jgi:hypothetical protein